MGGFIDPFICAFSLVFVLRLLCWFIYGLMLEYTTLDNSSAVSVNKWDLVMITANVMKCAAYFHG